MNRVLVVAPHPDDETLGAGGTLLLHGAAEHEVHWLIMTEMRRERGSSEERIHKRSLEVGSVGRAYGFYGTHRMGFETARLDTVPRSELVGAVASTADEVRPRTVYLPHPGDAHTDHRETFEACLAALKAFRSPDVERIYAYETPSETEANPYPVQRFAPNTFVDISQVLEQKIQVLGYYSDEMGPHPFPRSEEGIRALATTRGSQAAVVAAEAFMLIWERRAIGKPIS